MGQCLVVVAGIPPEISRQFEAAFSKLAPEFDARLTVLGPYGLELRYTDEYVNRIYGRLVDKLKKHGSLSREALLAKTQLIVLFLQKLDGSDMAVRDRFEIEAFVTPIMAVPDVLHMKTDTQGQRGQLVNKVIRGAKKAMRHARQVLPAIQEDLNDRTNKTCLLLPPKTFGGEFLDVRNRVWDAARRREPPKAFTEGLKALRISKSGRHFRGKGRLVYVAPPKSGSRHGLPPVWDDDHEPTCVIRGRLRFGVSFDPRFHYDCRMGRDSDRRFPGCHEPQQLPKGRLHANCAPNDSVR